MKDLHRWILGFSEMLCGVGWQFLTDVTGQPISPIFQNCLTCDYMKAVPKRRQSTTHLCHVTSQKKASLNYTTADVLNLSCSWRLDPHRRFHCDVTAFPHSRMYAQGRNAKDAEFFCECLTKLLLRQQYCNILCRSWNPLTAFSGQWSTTAGCYTRAETCRMKCIANTIL